MANPIGSFSKIGSDVFCHEIMTRFTLPEVGVLLRCSKALRAYIGDFIGVKELVGRNADVVRQLVDNTTAPWTHRLSPAISSYERVPPSFYTLVFLSIFRPNAISRMLSPELRRVVLDQMLSQRPQKELVNGRALLEAASIGHPEVISIILRTTAQGSITCTAEDLGKALIKTCKEGNLQAAWSILENASTFYTYKKKALFLAGKNGHLNITRNFVSFFLDTRNFFPPIEAALIEDALAGAAVSGSAMTVREIIDESHRTGLPLSGMTALEDASIAGNKDVIEELLTNPHLALEPAVAFIKLLFRGHNKGCLNLMNSCDMTQTGTLVLMLCQSFLVLTCCIIWIENVLFYPCAENFITHLIPALYKILIEGPIVPSIPVWVFGSFLILLMALVELTIILLPFYVGYQKFRLNDAWAEKNDLSLKERVKHILIPTPQDLIALPIIMVRIPIELARRGLSSIAHRFSALSPKTKAALGFLLALYAARQYYTAHQPEADFNAIN